ncbi:hypothetical protein P3X46_016827 [Hevea brasiliensis]|uniref:DUF7356 domain-containing protein n=1 Tax=Hevea brasiliensis TaxID=3981 RepID=A0ABQ9M0H5_HEVBR|nr:uncharacterized protein LOC110671550 [Hevea brasiliensis]XP_058009707.1 uncharacterized protein LOC110671550 [Hevea brasiliensis]XP_058009708.1 uncharacterized protein LOC110671550 [Hevea brasiliensis]XP_058009709.1 uncharacterized protein LOC110671550 [Hevea brasiliensis]KAJ9173717.1 hypothetical protein P3X46_016827 [Hevea brasiliensis]
METNRFLYLGMILLLLIVDFSFVDSKANVSAKNDLDPQSNNVTGSNEQAGELGSVSDSNGAHKEKKNKGNQQNKLKESIDDGKKNHYNSSGQSGSKKTDNLVNDTSKLNEKSQGESDDSKKKTMPKESSSGEESGHGTKGSRVEQCDPSNKCIDEDNNLVACLRVPGNDQYSLLIQNKGKNPLTVTISAPDFVQLEKTEIQLQAKEDKKVKVSIASGGSDNLIVLKSGKGHCSLDIRHLIDKEFDNSQKSTYLNFMSPTPTIVVLAIAALLILAAGWMCISFRRKQLFSISSKYQSLNMDLPVSGGGKPESEVNNGWDNSWGDDWDDEEAPKTPSLPVTPSLSSKGLASRRLNKEGWKD